MKKESKAYLQLHFAVFLFGFTAILGDLIQVSAFSIVWWRVLIASISFVFIIRNFDFIRKIGRKKLLTLGGIGVLIALHWVCFFAAVKFSNASITLICMATTAIFTSVIEPIYLKRRFEWFELIIGIIVLPAMILIVNNIAFEMRIGVLLGLISAFLASLFNTLNKKHIEKGLEKEISFVELGAAWIALSLLLPLHLLSDPDVVFLPSVKDIGFLLILALLCTNFAFVLSMKALNHITAFGSSLTMNLEPLYGIFIAMIILGEHKELNLNFYIGVILIIASVLIYPFIKNHKRRTSKTYTDGGQ